jgi:FkbM family methyltransferase
LGIGEDISFDLSVIESYGTEVFAFDPTPRSIQWVKAQSLPTQFHLLEYGIANYDGTGKFYVPNNPIYISHTLLSNMETGANYKQLPVRRIQTLMEMLGHEKIDILKMDIEGAEYMVINDLLESNIRPQQLLVEFHHRLLPVGIWRTYRILQKLKAFHYHIFSISSRGDEYSFILR